MAEAVTGCGIRVYAAQRWQLEGGHTAAAKARIQRPGTLEVQKMFG